MRTVLQGTATNLYRLTARDLPLDNDLSYSYWRWVDFSAPAIIGARAAFNGDLSAFNMQNMDIVDCVGNGTILPNHEVDGHAATDYLRSIRTSWTGAKIPANSSIWHADFIEEIFDQRARVNPADKEALWSRDYMRLEKYDLCWESAAFALLRQFGGTPDTVREIFRRLLEGYPRLQSWGMEATARMTEAVVMPKTNLKNMRVDLGPKAEYVDVKAEVGFAQYDTWALARSLEQLVGNDISVYVAALVPFPVIHADGYRSKVDPNWWQRKHHV